MPSGIYSNEKRKNLFTKGHRSGMNGKKHTINTKAKMRSKHFGKKMSDEARQKMSENLTGLRGSKSRHWKGGITNQQSSRQWRKNNYERVLSLNRKRRALKFLAVGTHTLGEWLNLKAQYNWTCPCCRIAEPKIVLTEDHIVPLSKGGSDNIENIQPLCRSCNSKKHTNIIKYAKF
jgi:5-methylcytosine-specific restriction endonuclease McrA